ncbi:MAG: T9SS type A sorting domain-containing protein [Bacteroidia bacterium]
MKKIYNLLFASAVMISASALAQTDMQNSHLNMTADQMQAKLANVNHTKPTAPLSRVSMSCDSLTTIKTGGNGFNGNMFDITVASNFTLETFSVSMDAGTWNVAIYYRTGTYVGSETSSTGWTFLDSASITSTTTDDTVLYKVPVSLNLPLMGGSTYGFYVTGTNSSSPINYTNGTSVGNVVSSNSYFSIKEGHGGAYPFNLTNSPRVFNGRAHYCAGIAGIDEVNGTTFSLYPNPASQSVSLDLSIFKGNTVNIRIVNALGQLIHAEQVVASNATELDLSNYESGMYFVQAEMNGKIITSSLAVK